MKSKRIISLLLTVMLLLALLPTAAFAKDGNDVIQPADADTKHVVVSVEAFPVNGGYIVEPTVLEVSDSNNGATIIKELLEVSGFECLYTGTVDSGFYISGIKGDALTGLPMDFSGIADILQEGLNDYHKENDDVRASADTLQANDYLGYLAGWLYTVNGVVPDDTLSAYTPEDGDVIRLQYSLAWGDDIGCGWGNFDLGYTAADKTELTRLIAERGAKNVPASALATAIKIDATAKEVEEAVALINKTIYLPYVAGYDDGGFHPEGELTRAEAAQMLYNIIGGESEGNAAFSDVEAGAWYEKAVLYLANTGVLSGDPSGTFRPLDTITRAEFATILVKYMDLDTSGTSSFTDVTAEYWAKGLIAAAQTAGYVSGYPDGTFLPENPVTRAEAVSMLNKMLERNVDTFILDELEMPFSDVEKGYWAWYIIMAASVTYSA